MQRVDCRSTVIQNPEEMGGDPQNGEHKTGRQKYYILLPLNDIYLILYVISHAPLSSRPRTWETG